MRLFAQCPMEREALVWQWGWRGGGGGGCGWLVGGGGGGILLSFIRPADSSNTDG